MIILRQKEFARKKGKKDVDYLKEGTEFYKNQARNNVYPEYWIQSYNDLVKDKNTPIRDSIDKQVAVNMARKHDRGGLEFTQERGKRQIRSDENPILSLDKEYMAAKKLGNTQRLKELNLERSISPRMALQRFKQRLKRV